MKKQPQYRNHVVATLDREADILEQRGADAAARLLERVAHAVTTAESNDRLDLVDFTEGGEVGSGGPALSEEQRLEAGRRWFDGLKASGRSVGTHDRRLLSAALARCERQGNKPKLCALLRDVLAFLREQNRAAFESDLAKRTTAAAEPDTVVLLDRAQPSPDRQRLSFPADEMLTIVYRIPSEDDGARQIADDEAQNEAEMTARETAEMIQNGYAVFVYVAAATGSGQPGAFHRVEIDTTARDLTVREAAASAGRGRAVLAQGGLDDADDADADDYTGVIWEVDYTGEPALSARCGTERDARDLVRSVQSLQGSNLERDGDFVYWGATPVEGEPTDEQIDAQIEEIRAAVAELEQAGFRVYEVGMARGAVTAASRKRPPVGARVRVDGMSGLDSDEPGTVVKPFDWREEKGAYKPVPDGYVFLKLDNGRKITMPSERLCNIDGTRPWDGRRCDPKFDRMDKAAFRQQLPYAEGAAEPNVQADLARTIFLSPGDIDALMAQGPVDAAAEKIARSSGLAKLIDGNDAIRKDVIGYLADTGAWDRAELRESSAEMLAERVLFVAASTLRDYGSDQVSRRLELAVDDGTAEPGQAHAATEREFLGEEEITALLGANQYERFEIAEYYRKAASEKGFKIVVSGQFVKVVDREGTDVCDPVMYNGSPADRSRAFGLAGIRCGIDLPPFLKRGQVHAAQATASSGSWMDESKKRGFVPSGRIPDMKQRRDADRIGLNPGRGVFDDSQFRVFPSRKDLREFITKDREKNGGWSALVKDAMHPSMLTIPGIEYADESVSVEESGKKLKSYWNDKTGAAQATASSGKRKSVTTAGSKIYPPDLARVFPELNDWTALSLSEGYQKFNEPRDWSQFVNSLPRPKRMDQRLSQWYDEQLRRGVGAFVLYTNEQRDEVLAVLGKYDYAFPKPYRTYHGAAFIGYLCAMNANSERGALATLDVTNLMAGQHGVDGTAIPDDVARPTFSMSYVNTGDTYSETLVWDSRDGFMLTSWGDWFEGAEQALAEDQDEDEDEGPKPTKASRRVQASDQDAEETDTRDDKVQEAARVVNLDVAQMVKYEEQETDAYDGLIKETISGMSLADIIAAAERYNSGGADPKQTDRFRDAVLAAQAAGVPEREIKSELIFQSECVPGSRFGAFRRGEYDGQPLLAAYPVDEVEVQLSDDTMSLLKTLTPNEHQQVSRLIDAYWEPGTAWKQGPDGSYGWQREGGRLNDLAYKATDAVWFCCVKNLDTFIENMNDQIEARQDRARESGGEDE